MGHTHADAATPARATGGNAYSFLAKCGAAAALVLAADWLFYGHTIGWTGGLFGLASLGAIIMTRPFTVRKIEGRVCLILAAGLCMALFNDPSLYAISLLVAAVVSVSLAPALAGRPDAGRWAAALASHALSFWIRLVADIPALARSKRRHNSLRAGPRVNQWALPLFGSTVFAGLFIAANPVVDDALMDWLTQHSVSPFGFYRFVFWVAVLIVVWSVLRPRVALKLVPNDERTTPSAVGQRVLSASPVFTSLVLFNLLFAGQNALDVMFLWSGSALPDGMTYAQYAHRGAYPLIATTLLAGAFVLVALHPDGAGVRKPAIRWLVYVWILQNVFLVCSSMLRVVDYVDAYSLTLMRLASLMWMALIAVGLVLICVRIFRSKSGLWLINANGLACIAVLYVCAFPDFNAFVANYNVRHSLDIGERGAPLDIVYLEKLGPSAIEALTWFENQEIIDWRQREATAARTRLTRELQCSLSDWRQWTYLRHRIWRKVETVEVPERLSMCTPKPYRSTALRIMESAP